MRELGYMKWLTGTCGVIGLATFLALSPKVSGNATRPISAPSPSPSLLARKSSSISLASSRNNSKVSKSQVMRQYAQLPLAFEPNASASSDKVKFLARGDGYTLLLANDEAVLKLRGPSETAAVVRMELAGANASPNFSALEELPGKSNYFIGNKLENWRVNVPQYRKILESNIYKGVDLVYYGTQGRLEYDFDVAPGIDPSVIRLAFQGAGRLRVNAQGDLLVNTSSGNVRLHKPVAYQEIAGSRHPVAVGYALKDKTSATFQLAEYDQRLPLVIDPVLSYSTYVGGSNIDTSNAIALASDKTAFIAGGTFSSDFPTVHALQPNGGGGPDFSQDAFVAKISADGSTLLYATYLGGKQKDIANGIAVDNAGDAFVTGTTLSPDFPVSTDSFNTLCGGDGKCGTSWNTLNLLVTNAFVTKLNPAGSAIVYSGYVGEYENVSGQAIAVDGDNNAYVTGSTNANFAPTVTITPPAVGPPPFPITSSAFQPTYGGGKTNAFVTKIDATGATILYSSYLGGNIEDTGYGIVLDSSANAYVTGLTYSTNFPTTSGALQSTFGGAGDAFVAKVNTDASGLGSLVYSTYLGGSGLDQGNGIAIDSAGNAYVAGLTNSASFTFAPTGFQKVYAGQGDAFVAKLNPTGGISYFTYLGGANSDAATGIALDPSRNAYVTGTTVSTNFPTSGSVFQPTYGGGNADSFVAKLDPTGATLVYSSFLGGTNTELATGVAVDSNGSAYVTGQTCSEDFPLSNPLQVVPGGNCDGYIAKVTILAGIALNPQGLVFPAQSLNTTSQSQTVTLTNGDNQQTVTSIAISGPNASDFTQTNTCNAPSLLPVGGTCAVTVTFDPSAAGIRKASVVITDSAPGSPHVVNLTGNTSSVSLSASTLSFGSQQVGASSSSQSVTVTNSGSIPLTISSITASGDYSETDTCTKAALQPANNCVINVTFSPSAPGGSVGSITINDTGAGSPQVIMVTGTGMALAITSSTPTLTVSAGETAKYVLTVPPVGGSGQTVNLICKAPANANISCQVTPGTVVPTSNSPQTAILTVTTALRTSAPPRSTFKFNPPSGIGQFRGTWLLWLTALLLLCIATLRRRPLTATFGFAVVLLLASVACGGSGGGYGGTAGTPADKYVVTVIGTSPSGTLLSSTQVTLQVN